MLLLLKTGFLRAPKALLAAWMRALTSVLSVAVESINEPRYLKNSTIGIKVLFGHSTGVVAGIPELWPGMRDSLGTNRISLLESLWA